MTNPTTRTASGGEKEREAVVRWLRALGISPDIFVEQLTDASREAWRIAGERRRTGEGQTMLRAAQRLKKLRLGRGAVGKTAVLAMRERGGRTVGFPITSTDAGTIKNEIHRRVEIGSTLHTDEASVYQGMDGLFYRHETINHTAGEYRRDDVTTNGIESVFAVLKRGLIGVYHHASPKHLGRYVNEFAFRLNEGDVKRHTLVRLDSFITASAGKRLTYEGLIA